MQECENCEFRNSPTLCFAAKIGRTRLCELAHDLGRPDYREAIAWLTQAEYTPGEPPLPQPVTPDLRDLMLVATCEFRYSECNCIDKPATCKPGGKHPGPVTLQICMDCVQESC